MTQSPTAVIPTAAPAPATAHSTTADKPSADSQAKTEISNDDKYITIKSPMIGTFYRKPSPDKDTFVNVGDNIKSGDVLCVIEAMKLFNEIEPS